MKHMISVDSDLLALACMTPLQAEQRGWDTNQAAREMGKAQAALRQHMDKTGTLQPADMILMPRALTAENGAKALMLGEFKDTIELQCACVEKDTVEPQCSCVGCEESNDECEICNGDGTYLQEVTIDWSVIKSIYARAAEHLGQPALSAMGEVSSSLAINGHQLLEALGLLAPDGSKEQLDQELVLLNGTDKSHSGPGVYAYYKEYPEEGAILLDGASELGQAFVPARRLAGVVQGKSLVPSEGAPVQTAGSSEMLLSKSDPAAPLGE